jgi:capsular exopolysaccharide synthesis family protein
MDENNAGTSPVPAGGRAPGYAALPLPLEDQPPTHPDIDLVGYWRVLVKRRWLILAILVAVLAATLVLTFLATPLYRATAVMEIDDQVQQVVEVDGMATQPPADAQFQQTQYELLKSRSLANRVARTLSLEPAQMEALSDGEAAVPPADANEGDGNVDLATTLVQQGTTIEPVRDSHLVKVHFDSPDPVLSAKIANALAEGFIQSGLERRYGASSYAKNYLEEQLRQVKARLEASERQLVRFAQEEGLVSSPEGQSLASSNLADLNEALAQAQAQRIRAQARWGQASSGGALPADMLGESIIRELQASRAKLQAEYQEKLQVYEPGYPEMQQLKGQIDAITRQIQAEHGNIRASVRAEYTAAASQERLLQGKLDALRAQALDVDSRSIEYNILKREVDTNRQLYDGLLQRYKQVGVAGDVRANNVSIIDPARVPERPYKPNLSVNLAIGLLVGLLLGVLAAFLLEYMDETIKTPEDVEKKLRLPVLGVVPLLHRQSPEQAFEEPRSAFSESYRSVRTALQFSTNQGIPRTLLITSALSGEGKTTSALSLARNVAQLGKRVLLVDADLRNPSIHKLLGCSQLTGLSNVLSGSAGFEGVVQESGQQGLSVVTSGPLPPNPAELLAGPPLAELLARAVQEFDQVILDGPPVMGLADAPILAHTASATLLVVHAGKTGVGSAQAALKRLRFARARIVGALLTQYDARATGYGYGSEGYYAYGQSQAPERR